MTIGVYNILKLDPKVVGECVPIIGSI
jgi:hypothetical protein